MTRVELTLEMAKRAGIALQPSFPRGDSLVESWDGPAFEPWRDLNAIARLERALNERHEIVLTEVTALPYIGKHCYTAVVWIGAEEGFEADADTEAGVRFQALALALGLPAPTEGG